MEQRRRRAPRVALVPLEEIDPEDLSPLSYLPESVCRGCQTPCDYEFCNACAKTQRCAHGVVINDGCPECDIESDRAYDEGRA